MIDVFEVAARLVDLVKARHADEVDLIAYYGSRATGTAGPASDLDLFFVPAEGKNPAAARCFVVDGVTFDFWPISWDLAGEIAEGRFRGWAVAPSILSRAVVLWARNDEARERLEALRDRIGELAEDEEGMARRAQAAVQAAFVALDRLRGTTGAWPVVTACLECLALVNRVTFDGGWARAVRELDRLEIRPPGLERLVTTLVTSRDRETVRTTAVRLVNETRRVLRLRPAGEVFRGCYPELHEHLQKLVAACDAGDAVRASLETWLVSDEVREMFRASSAEDPGLPDLEAAYDPDDLESLGDLARDYDARLVAWFGEIGVATNVLADLDELDVWLTRL